MDRRTLWAVGLMMLIALIPTFFLKKPDRRSDGRKVSDSVAAASPAPPVAPAVAPSDRRTAVPSGPSDTLTVTTPLARYGVATEGARLVSLALTKYQSQVPATKGQPANLIGPDESLLGFALIRGSDTVHVDRWNFTGGPRQLSVAAEQQALTLTGSEGDLAVRITYTFSPVDYQVGVAGRISGLGVEGGRLQLSLNTGIANTEADSGENYRLAALVTHSTSAERHDFGGFDAGVTKTFAGPFDWAAVKSKYFVASVLAFDSAGGRLSGVTATAPADAGKRPTRAKVVLQMPVSVSGDFAYTLYAGPMEYDRLSRLGRDFDDVNPYGWPGFRTLIRFFATPVRWLLVWMHESLHLHYGIVLILFGLLVRLLLWPLNQKAMRASTALQALQPKLQSIQERYKNDPPQLQKEMFALYKEHKVNPLGGCWPMLLPMPVLFALFFVLGNSIELRGVPFLWFPDLSRPDPLYIIPVLSGISMFALSKVGQMGIQHTPQTKLQAQMMLYMMPVMITFFGLQFASGLNLYWTVSNLASAPQQWLIGRERMKLQKAEVKEFVAIKTQADEAGKRTESRAEKRRRNK
jgi:YidC/Oxa1 family membrane protein insertase